MRKKTHPVDEPFFISLTGKNSHEVVIERGQGDFSIGPGPDKDFKKFDAIVDKDTPILWEVFDDLTDPEDLKKYSSTWPKWLNYLGNDSSFIEWSKKRKISFFHWRPYKNQDVDLKGSQIYHFTIEVLPDVKIKLKNVFVEGLTDDLIVEGVLDNVEIKTNHLKMITLHPKLSKDPKTPAYSLPLFPTLSEIEYLSLETSPVGQALDCKSLLQLPNLKTLRLSGNLFNLNYLSNLKSLNDLQLRYCPNLEGLARLETWSKLNSFIAWNVEEENGKLLRSQLKKLKKEREMEYSTVSQLRSQKWFLEEYGSTFSGWESKSSRVATKAYKKAAKIIAEAKNEVQIKKAIIEFTETFNKLEDIESTERDDLGVAIERLADINPDGVDLKKALEWFDEVRDF